MGKTVPIFDDHGRHFQADACRAPAEAAAKGDLRLEALVHGHYPGRHLPRGTLHGVKSVGYWDAEVEQEWGLDWHCNEGIELTLLETGRLEFATPGHAAVLEPDCVTITRPWQRHRLGSPRVTPGRLHWLILDVGVRRPDQPWRWPRWIVLSNDDLGELTRFLRHNEEPVWPCAADIRRCFRRIGEAVAADRAGSNVSRLAIHLNELLLLLLEMLRGRDLSLDQSLSERRRSVALFLDDLRSNDGLLAREWSVREMARSCGLGETRFAHYCKTLTNMTPQQYLNHHRLQAAAEMLRDHRGASVSDVAAACGFSSPQYFATTFRRHFQTTPGDYQKSPL